MLVRIETPRGDWKTNYDPLGRRTHKLFENKKVDFYWDTDRLAAEVHEDGSLRIYIYAGCFAMTPLLFIEYESINADPISGSPYFVFSNHLGAPVRVEDEQGKVAWSANLDPYGTAHVLETVRVEMPLRFPGHYFDAETGLHYNRFRYYSPELGRYLQSDPLGIAGGINLYAYPRNPLKLVDVRGACPAGATTDEDEENTTDNDDDSKDQEQNLWDAMMTKIVAGEDEKEAPLEIPWEKVNESREQYERAAAAARDLGGSKAVAAAGDGMYASGTNPVPGFNNVPVDDVRTALDGDSDPPGSTLFPSQPSDQAFLDNGDPGSYNASHAEMQASAAQPGQPIGVSRPLCDNCPNALSQVAKDTGEPQVITDPNGTHVFHPNGGYDFLGWD